MRKLLPLILFFITSLGFAQQTYYSDVNLTLSGTALRDELATKIISTHTKFLSYSNVWDASKITDLDPNDATNSNVILVYGYSDVDGNYVTDRTRDKNLSGGTAPTQWNREHTYAKSLGTPNLGTAGPGSDAHHLRPADITFNGQRASLKFATGTGNAGGSNGGWYPGDEWKGDIARMMMYMYIRYGTQCYPSGVTIGSTNTVDAKMIDLLLVWNAADPVSQLEDNRNTYHENTSNTFAQGNRNPFIDNPNLATQIWGGTLAEDRWNLTPDTEVPSDPTNLIASNITNTTVDLNWTASTDNVAVNAYDIYVDDGGGAVLFATSATASITLTGLTINTNYDITVYAKDAAENTSGVSNTLNITTTNIIDNTPPSIPTNLVVSNETNTSIDISWTASTDNIGIKEYDVYIDGSYSATSTSTSFTADGLAPLTTYSFSVLARDTSDNVSILSIDVNGTTTATPSFCGSETFTSSNAPIGGYGTDSFDGDNGITWSYVNSRDDEGYEITGTGLMLDDTSSKVTSSTVANGIGEFTCSLLKGFTGVGDRQVSLYINGVFKGNSITWDDTTVQTFTVSGINISGNIIVEIRNAKGKQVIIDDISWSCFASSDSEAPTTITNLSSTNITSSSADLAWTAATDNVGVTYYEIYKDGVFLASSPTNYYSVTGLSAGTSYNFTVKAKDAAGNTSLVSNTVTVTTATVVTGASELFISEYVEGGSGTNKAIEIANFTGSSIDLSIYSLAREYSGTGGWKTILTLTGTLANNDVFVAANSSDGTIVAAADYRGTDDALLFSGDDPVGLFKNGVLIDVVGTFNGATGNFAANTTLRRKPTISSPNTTYTLSEWDTFPTDTFSGLGTHTLSSLGVQTFVENLFKMYPNPTNSNSATIRINSAIELTNIQLYNTIGQLVINIVNPKMSNNSIEITNIPKGMYIVKIQSDTAYSTKRLIVQ